MKRLLLEIGFLITLLVAAFGIAALVFSFLNNDLLYDILVGKDYMAIRYLINLSIIAFAIFLIVVWNRNDKRTGRLILLLLLNVYYMPIYYRLSVKKGWID
jgi:Ca2+/Na+ antiporter